MTTVPEALPGRPWFRGSSVVGSIVMAAGLVLYGAAAARIVSAGLAEPLVDPVWRTDAFPLGLAGRWLVAGLVAVMKLVPGLGPESLIIANLGFTALAVALLARTLRLRNWSPRQATLVALLLSLHPTTLYLATTGQPELLAVAVTALLVLSVDRAEAHGDAQALMGIGVSAALLFVTTANAIYIMLPVLMLLPVALRDMTSMAAAVSLFVLTLVPAIVVVGGIMVASDSLGLRIGDVVGIWSAPLHGVVDPKLLSAPFIATHGGRYGATLVDLGIACLVCTPQLWLIVLRAALRRAERRRPATALLALAVASVSDACAATFWHLGSAWHAVAVSNACTMAWANATSLRRSERRLWLLLLLAGDLLAWLGPWLWNEPDKLAWYRALLGTS